MQNNQVKRVIDQTCIQNNIESYNGWSFGNNTQYDVGQPEVMLIDNLEQRLHDRQDLAAAQFRQ